MPRASLLRKTGKSASYTEMGHRSRGKIHPLSWPCCRASPDQPVLPFEQMSHVPVVPPRISLSGTTKRWPRGQLGTAGPPAPRSPPPVLSSGEHSRAWPPEKYVSPPYPVQGIALEQRGSIHVVSPCRFGQFLPTYQPREALACARGGVCAACCSSWTTSRASAEHQPFSSRG